MQRCVPLGKMGEWGCREARGDAFRRGRESWSIEEGGTGLERGFRRAKEAIEGLFWDWCVAEEFAEKETAWGERLHERQAGGEGFPCRLTERTRACGADGLLAEAEREAVLLYPADRKIPTGSDVRVMLGNGEERLYTAAGECRHYRTHKECGLKRKGTV